MKTEIAEKRCKIWIKKMYDGWWLHQKMKLPLVDFLLHMVKCEIMWTYSGLLIHADSFLWNLILALMLFSLLNLK